MSERPSASISPSVNKALGEKDRGRDDISHTSHVPCWAVGLWEASSVQQTPRHTQHRQWLLLRAVTCPSATLKPTEEAQLRSEARTVKHREKSGAAQAPPQARLDEFPSPTASAPPPHPDICPSIQGPSVPSVRAWLGRQCELLLRHIHVNPPGSLWLREGRNKGQALILIVRLCPPAAHRLHL